MTPTREREWWGKGARDRGAGKSCETQKKKKGKKKKKEVGGVRQNGETGSQTGFAQRVWRRKRRKERKEKRRGFPSHHCPRLIYLEISSHLYPQKAPPTQYSVVFVRRVFGHFLVRRLREMNRVLTVRSSKQSFESRATSRGLCCFSLHDSNMARFAVEQLRLYCVMEMTLMDCSPDRQSDLSLFYVIAELTCRSFDFLFRARQLPFLGLIG